MLTTPKSVQAIRDRITAAEAEIQRADAEVLAATESWKTAVEFGDAEAKPLKRRLDGESAATAARERLEILQALLVTARRAAIPETASATDAAMAALNHRAREVAKTLLSAYQAAADAALEIRTLGAEFDSVLRAFATECRALDIPRPAMSAGMFVIDRKELNARFRVDCNPRLRLDERRLLPGGATDGTD